MTERHHAQLSLAAIVLYGIAIKSPEELMDAELRRVDVAGHGPLRSRSRMLVLRKLRAWTFERPPKAGGRVRSPPHGTGGALT
jgi:hypothetical protein